MSHHVDVKAMARLLTAGALLCVCAALSGCGGASSAATPPPGGNAPVTGVSMPSSISVVTATNAG